MALLRLFSRLVLRMGYLLNFSLGTLVMCFDLGIFGNDRLSSIVLTLCGSYTIEAASSTCPIEVALCCRTT